ncbi:MAG TPA: hypothetical protein VII63_06510 [Caulobacteraceae bacterium]
MKSTRLGIVIVAALAAAALAHGARAEQARSTPAGDSYVVAGDFAFQSNSSVPSSSRRTMEWDARKGRWGLKLDVEQHSDGGRRWDDVQPGVFFKVTPRLHIGGAVSLAPQQIDQPTPANTPQAPAPRVRLETTFKF